MFDLDFSFADDRPTVDSFPYERCADCGAEVHVDRLDDGLCTGCALADAMEGRIAPWGVSPVTWDASTRFVRGE